MEIAELQVVINTAPMKDAEKDLTSLSRAAKQTEGSFDGLTNSVKALATGWAAMKLMDTVKELALLGMRHETLGATLGVMAANVNKTRGELEFYEQKLMSTGISALSARHSLQIMAAAQLDVARAAELGRIAQDAGTLANINSSHAFSNLVRGIATGETRIIRHMGIMVNFKRAMEEWHTATGKSIKQISEEEKARIRLQEVVDQGFKRRGVYEAAMATAGKQLLSMERYVEDVKVLIGSTFNSAANSVIFDMAEGLGALNKRLVEFKESGDMAILGASLRAYAQDLTAVLSKGGSLIYDHATAIKFLIGTYASFKIAGFVVELNKERAELWKTMMARRQAAIQNAMNRKVEEAATLDGLRTQQTVMIAEQVAANRKFQTSAVYKQQAADRIRMNEMILQSELRLANAEAALATAKTTTSRAASALGAAINGMGGPLGAAITLVGLFTTAVMLMDEETNKAAESFMDLADSFNDDMRQKLEAQQRFREALLREKNPDEVREKAWSADDDPRVRGMAKLVREQESKLSEMTGKLAGLKTTIGGLPNPIAMNAAYRLSHDIKAQQQMLEGSKRLLANSRDMLTYTHKEEVRAENKLREMANTARERKGEDDENTANTRILSARRALLDIERQISDEKMRGTGISDHELRIIKKANEINKLKEEADALQKQKNPARSAKELADYKKALDTLLAEFTAAESRVDNLDRRNNTIKEESALVTKLSDDLTALRQKNDEYGMSESEVARSRMNSMFTLKLQREMYADLIPQMEAEMKREEQIAQRRQRYNEGMRLLKREDASTIVQRTQDIFDELDMRKVIYPLELYKEKMREARLAELQFRAENGGTWAIIGYNVSQGGQVMADVFATWMGHMNEYENKWVQLRDTVRKAIADMLIDMARMTLQKKVMEPLFQWAGIAMGSWFSTPAGTTGSGSVSMPWTNTDLSGGYGRMKSVASGYGIDAAVIPSGTSGVVKNSYSEDKSEFHLHIYDSGEQKSSGTGTQRQQNLADIIAPMVRQVLSDERRTGNDLSPMFSRR